ncbi:MAG: flagellar filament capping protein FliD, partial [Pseudomonadota bacterium]
STFTATATSLAEVDNYSVQVDKVARAQSLSSSNFASVDSVIGTGTLTLSFGTTTTGPYGFTANAEKPAKVITVDSNNNTLSSMRDHINNNDYGVKASILNDGSGFKLILKAEDTGAKNSVQLVVTGDADGNNTDNTAGLSRLAFNSAAQNITQNTAAQDAQLKIDGLDITSESNTISNAINGVTLDLLKADVGVSKSLNVSRNTDGIKEEIKGFVDSYNSLATYVSEITSYNSESGEAALLLGDSTIRNLFSQMRNALFGQVSGTGNTDIKALADLGVLSSQRDGSLTLDETKLDAAIARSAPELNGLFSQAGTATDPDIQFVSSTSKTEPGSYAIKITQTATKGFLNTAGVLPNFGGGGTVTIDANNDTFKIRIDGTASKSLNLTQGVYASGEALAVEIQARINEDTNLSAQSKTVSVAYNSTSNRFDFTSNVYGVNSAVAIMEVDTNSAAQLGFSVAAGTQGIDVAGSIDGIEAAGSGQFLVGTSGKTLGLKIGILGGAFSVGGEARGTITFSRGIADKVDRLIDGFLEAKGTLDSKTTGLTASLTSIETSRANLTNSTAKLEARLLAQFSAMDAIVGRLNSVGSFLESALGGLPGAKES